MSEHTVYRCVYACMHMYLRVHRQVVMYIYVGMLSTQCVYIYMHVRVYTCVICIFMCACVCTYVYNCIYISAVQCVHSYL